MSFKYSLGLVSYLEMTKKISRDSHEYILPTYKGNNDIILPLHTLLVS